MDTKKLELMFEKIDLYFIKKYLKKEVTVPLEMRLIKLINEIKKFYENNVKGMYIIFLGIYIYFFIVNEY